MLSLVNFGKANIAIWISCLYGYLVLYFVEVFILMACEYLSSYLSNETEVVGCSPILQITLCKDSYNEHMVGNITLGNLVYCGSCWQ